MHDSCVLRAAEGLAVQCGLQVYFDKSRLLKPKPEFSFV